MVSMVEKSAGWTLCQRIHSLIQNLQPWALAVCGNFSAYIATLAPRLLPFFAMKELKEQLETHVDEACKWLRMLESARGHVEHFLEKAVTLAEQVADEAEDEMNEVYDNDMEETADIDAIADKKGDAELTGDLCRDAIQVMKQIQVQLEEMDSPKLED